MTQVRLNDSRSNRVLVESPAVSRTFVFKKCWTDTNGNMTDITKQIKKTNEEAESIQKTKEYEAEEN